MSRATYRRPWLLSLILLTLPALRVAAGESGKLLPADTAFVVSVNLKEFLGEPAVQKSAAAQTFLDAFRLALDGDEARLKKYYEHHTSVLKDAGFTQEDFLAWAKSFKSSWAARGVNPLKDIHRLTAGVRAAEGGSGLTVAVGAFDLARIEKAAEERAKQNPKSLKTSKVGDFAVYQWSAPGQPPECLAASARLVLIADSEKQMTAALDRAAGRKKDGLAEPMRTLVAEMEEEQFGVVVSSVDVVLQAIEVALKKQPVSAKDPIAAVVTREALAWLRKYAKDVTILSVGLTFQADEFYLQAGLGTTSPKVAKELRSLIVRNNFLGSLLLRGAGDDVPRQLADILRTEKVSVKGSTTLLRARIPYKFVKKLLESRWP